MKSPKKENGGYKKTNQYKPPQSMRDIKEFLDLFKVKDTKTNK
jgi:hypothetical protein